MEIRVYGMGCARCHELHQRVINVLARLDLTADVEHITAPERLAEAGILMTPAITVDGVLKSSGRVPSETEIAGWVRPSGS